jgi:hypothetical protein
MLKVCRQALKGLLQLDLKAFCFYNRKIGN